MRDRTKQYLGIITEVDATIDEDGYADPLTTRYAGEATNTNDVIRVALAVPPERPTSGVKVIPAKEGHPCILQHRPGERILLWPLTERTPFEDCSNIGDAAAGTVVLNQQQLINIIRGIMSGSING